MREWNAEAYHRVSSPQLQWGLTVLNRLRVSGQELVVDVGCGTGRLTEHLAWRVPRGRVVGVDISSNMLEAARDYLRSLAGTRVVLARAEATALPFHECADVVFSTATFHWVLDHQTLFRSLFQALRPGGRLVAQCGGGPNIARLVGRAGQIASASPFAPHFAGWKEPWLFADAAGTAGRLAAAGFRAVDTSEEYSPVTFPTAEAFRDFAANVVCRPYLAQLPSELQSSFMDRIVEEYSRDETPFELDYWRLNMAGRRPVHGRP